MVKLSPSRLYCALVAFAFANAQDSPLAPVNQKSTLPEPYKLALWTTDKEVTVYINGRDRHGKLGAPMPGERECYRPTPMNEDKLDECIGDVAINKVNDETVLFEIHRDHWTADTYQQCRLRLVRVPVLFNGAFEVMKTDGSTFQPAPGDEERVKIECDLPKKD